LEFRHLTSEPLVVVLPAITVSRCSELSVRETSRVRHS
jgi:hypothetical protein